MTTKRWLMKGLLSTLALISAPALAQEGVGSAASGPAASGPAGQAEALQATQASPRAATGTTPCMCDPRVCDPSAGQPDPNAHRHDGFFLRITAGGGYLWGSGEPSTEADGYAGTLGLAVGSMVAENLGLYIDMYGANAFRSGLSVDGAEDTTFNVVLQTSSIGLGATYYLMPANVYAALSVGAGVLYTTAYTRLDDAYTLTGSEVSKFGPSVSLSLGKEWWVSSDWGIGLSGAYSFLSVNGGELGEYTVDSVQHVTVRVSATFN